MTTEHNEISQAETFILEGRTLLQDGNLPAAVARFRLATKEDPGVSLAWNDLGVALYASQQYAMATEAFITALTMTPEYADAALNYATLCRKIDRPMDATPFLRACYRHNPGDNELLAALKKLGLDQHRPVALIMTKTSDQSTEILQNTLRELGYAAYAPDPRIVSTCSTTVRLTQNSWERYYALIQPSIILIDDTMDGTELPLSAARAKDLPHATIGGTSADLPNISEDELGAELATFLRLHKEYTPPTSRVSPTMSVITQTTRGAKALTQLLDHLALQDIEKGIFEVIVVDNGSDIPVTDTISETDYAFKLKIIRQERATAAASKNAGIDAAKGRWVLFYDAASVPVSTSIRQHIIAQMSSPKSYAVSGPTMTQPELVNNSFRRLVEKQPIIYGHNQMIHDRVYGGATFPNSNVSIERKHLIALNGFDEKMPSGIEESELGYRLEKELSVQVKYNEEIYCETQKVYDVDDFLRRQSIQGWSCHFMWRKHDDASFIHGDADTPPHEMFFLALRLEVEQNEHRIRTVTNKLNRVCQLEMRVGESRGEEIIQTLTHRSGIHEFSRGLVVAESGFSLGDIRPKGLLHVQKTTIYLRDTGNSLAAQATIESLRPLSEQVRIITDVPLESLEIPTGMVVDSATEAETITGLDTEAIGFVDAGVVFPPKWRNSVLDQLEAWPDIGIVAPNLGYMAGPDGELPKETLHVYRRTLDNRCVFIHRAVFESLKQIGAEHPMEVGSEIFFKRTRLAGFLLRHALGCIFPKQSAQQLALTGTGTGG